jgi:hypothetical protein
MEWGGPEQIELSSAREKAFEEDPLFASRIMKLEAEHERDVSNYEKDALMNRLHKKYISPLGSVRTEKNYWKALSKAIEAGDQEAIDWFSQNLYGYPKRVAKEEMPVGAAQGGRIGYRGGGIYEKALTDAWKTYIKQGGTLSLEKFADEWMKAMTKKAQGGRIGAQEGGLMDLGGMEKDYRQEGGFVPIGGREKADDVPARLSKNEFVFTADAVRAAGGGDIDQGAEVMENVMENLEAGGRISEESQGLEGARNMFANAQALEKRII